MKVPGPGSKLAPGASGVLIMDYKGTAALVVARSPGGLPAPGFFDCAARLGRSHVHATGPKAFAFHAKELNAAVAFRGANVRQEQPCLAAKNTVPSIKCDSRSSALRPLAQECKVLPFNSTRGGRWRFGGKLILGT